MLKRVAVFAVVLAGCTPPAPPTKHDPEIERRAGLARVFLDKTDKFKRQLADIEKDEAKATTNDDRRDIADKYATLITTCDEVLLAKDRLEQAGGLDPNGQKFIESVEKVKRVAKAYIALYR